MSLVVAKSPPIETGKVADSVALKELVLENGGHYDRIQDSCMVFLLERELAIRLELTIVG